MPAIKTGVSLDPEVLDKLNRYMRIAGYRNRSRVINQALNLYIVEKEALLQEGKGVGVLTLLYDHTVSDIEHNITHIQHDYLDIIVSSIHVHLDNINCLEVIVVRGDIKRIRKLAERLENLKGMKVLRHVLSRICEK